MCPMKHWCTVFPFGRFRSDIYCHNAFWLPPRGRFIYWWAVWIGQAPGISFPGWCIAWAVTLLLLIGISSKGSGKWRKGMLISQILASSSWRRSWNATLKDIGKLCDMFLHTFPTKCTNPWVLHCRVESNSRRESVPGLMSRAQDALCQCAFHVHGWVVEMLSLSYCLTYKYGLTLRILRSLRPKLSTLSSSETPVANVPIS